MQMAFSGRWKASLAGLALGSAVALAACGGASGASGAPASSAGPSTTASSTPSSQSGTAQAAPQAISVKVVGSEEGRLGPDGKKHDTFIPSDLTVQAGAPVAITFTNSDDMPHSFSAPDLGINQIIPAAKDGKPGQVTLTFTPTKRGKFRWFCAMPCDTDAGGWAMTPDRGGHGPDQDGFMAGYVTVS
jgi:heme/copper-type cytochrome/quinol oxidase subunit 2